MILPCFYSFNNTFIYNDINITYYNKFIENIFIIHKLLWRCLIMKTNELPL